MKSWIKIKFFKLLTIQEMLFQAKANKIQYKKKQSKVCYMCHKIIIYNHLWVEWRIIHKDLLETL